MAPSSVPCPKMLRQRDNSPTNPAGSPRITDTAAREKANPQWDRFKDFVKNIAAVPKEEVDELRAEREREKKEGF